jgi:hypothetical protein
VLNQVLMSHKEEITLVISGGAKGADAMAELWAKAKTTSIAPNYTSQPNCLQL